MKTTITEKGKSYRLSEIVIEDSEDLHEFIGRLPYFLDIAENSGRQLVVEIWLNGKKETLEEAVRNHQTS